MEGMRSRSVVGGRRGRAEVAPTTPIGWLEEDKTFGCGEKRNKRDWDRETDKEREGDNGDTVAKYNQGGRERVRVRERDCSRESSPKLQGTNSRVSIPENGWIPCTNSRLSIRLPDTNSRWASKSVTISSVCTGSLTDGWSINPCWYQFRYSGISVACPISGPYREVWYRNSQLVPFGFHVKTTLYKVNGVPKL